MPAQQVIDERVVRVLVRFGLDKQSSNDLRNGLVSVDDAVRRVTQDSPKAQETVKQLDQEFKKLEQEGSRVQMSAKDIAYGFQYIGIGALSLSTILTGPVIAAIGKYQSQVGKTEAASRNWTATEERQAAAMTRVGRAAAMTALPAMEKMAKLSEDIAAWAEKNPQAVGAMASIGVIAGAIGALSMVLRVGIPLVMSTIDLAKQAGMVATNLLAAKTMDTAAKTNLTASAAFLAASRTKLTGDVGGIVARGAQDALPVVAKGLPAVIAALLAVAKGIASVLAVPVAVTGAALAAGTVGATPIVNAIKTSRGEKPGNILQTGAEALGTLAQTMASTREFTREKVWDKIFPGLSNVQRGVDAWILRKLGVAEQLPSGGAAGMGLGEQLRGKPAFGQGVEAYAQYQRTLKDTEKQYQDQRLEMVKNFEATRLETETANREQLASTIDSYMKGDASTRKSFDHQQELGLRSFLRNESQIESDYRKNRETQVKKFNESQTEYNKGFDADRLKQIQAFNEDSIRIQAQHDLDMRRMAQDYSDSMEDAVGRRDAIAAYQLTKSYEKNKARAEEDFQDQDRQRRGDFDAALKETKDNFAKESTERQAEFNKSLKEQDDNFKEERLRRKDAFDLQNKDSEEEYAYQKKLRDQEFITQVEELKKQQDERLAKMDTDNQVTLQKFDDAYKATQDKMTADFNDHLRQMGLLMGKDLDLYNTWYESIASSFENLLVRMAGEAGAPTNLPGLEGTRKPEGLRGIAALGGMAEGGYLGKGIFKAGEEGNEFLASAQTTRALESALGGRVTQDKLAAMAAASQSGTAAPITLQMSYSFGGNVSDGDKQWFKQEAYSQARVAFRDALREARRG